MRAAYKGNIKTAGRTAKPTEDEMTRTTYRVYTDGGRSD